jgi:GTP-binding protein
MPNVGKSTLLSRLSSARPRIAPFPFTTVRPHLGVLESPEGEERLTLADIPGLVEGAHRGAGLGLRFLRHVERTRMFLHILDMDPASGRTPMEDFRVLREEIRQYDPSLLGRPEMVALNKMDLPGARGRAARVRRSLTAKGLQVFPVSGLTGEGIEELGKALLRAHGALLAEEPLCDGGPGLQSRSASRGRV